MKIRIYISRILFNGLLLFLLFAYVKCASNKGQWRLKLTYSSEKIGKDRLLTDFSLFFLPIVNGNKFDTFSVYLNKKFKKAIGKQVGCKVYFKKDFEKLCVSSECKMSLVDFYNGILKDDILEITTCDSVWKYIPGRYMIIIRIKHSVRISSLEGILKRKAFLKAELWDSENVGVVWRAESSGYEMNEKVTDKEFIHKGIKEILGFLPAFVPVRDEKDW